MLPAAGRLVLVASMAADPDSVLFRGTSPAEGIAYVAVAMFAHSLLNFSVGNKLMQGPVHLQQRRKTEEQPPVSADGGTTGAITDRQDEAEGAGRQHLASAASPPPSPSAPAALEVESGGAVGGLHAPSDPVRDRDPSLIEIFREIRPKVGRICFRSCLGRQGPRCAQTARVAGGPDGPKSGMPGGSLRRPRAPGAAPLLRQPWGRRRCAWLGVPGR